MGIKGPAVAPLPAVSTLESLIHPSFVPRNGTKPRLYPLYSTPTGRFCLSRTCARFDPLSEGLEGAFSAYYGLGVSTLFKTIKQMSWTLLLCVIFSLPMLWLTSFADSPSAFEINVVGLQLSVTTLGNILASKTASTHGVRVPWTTNTFLPPQWLGVVYYSCDIAIVGVLLLSYYLLKLAEQRESDRTDARQRGIDRYSLYVTNLPPDATEDDVATHFETLYRRVLGRHQRHVRGFSTSGKKLALGGGARSPRVTADTGGGGRGASSHKRRSNVGVSPLKQLDPDVGVLGLGEEGGSATGDGYDHGGGVGVGVGEDMVYDVVIVNDSLRMLPLYTRRGVLLHRLEAVGLKIAILERALKDPFWLQLNQDDSDQDGDDGCAGSCSAGGDDGCAPGSARRLLCCGTRSPHGTGAIAAQRDELDRLRTLRDAIVREARALTALATGDSEGASALSWLRYGCRRRVRLRKAPSYAPETPSARASKKIAGTPGSSSEDSEPPSAAISAFVTLDRPEAVEVICQEYGGGEAAVWCQPRRLRMNGYRLRVGRAPPPSTILWQNVHVRRGEQLARRFGTTLAAAVVIAAVFVGLFLLAAQRQSLQANAASVALGCAAFEPAIRSGAINGTTVLDVLRLKQLSSASSYGSPFITLLGGLLGSNATFDASQLVPCFCEHQEWAPNDERQSWASRTTVSSIVDDPFSPLCASYACPALLRVSATTLVRTPFCVDWYASNQGVLGLSFGASAAVIAINNLLQWLMRLLTAVEAHHSVDGLNTSLALRLFIAQVLVTAGIPLAVNAPLPASLLPSLASRPDVFNDFTARWYSQVGTTLITTMLLSVLSVHAWPLLQYAQLRRKRATLDPARYPTEQQLYAALMAPAADFSARWASLQHILFVCLMFGTGLPLQFAVCLAAWVASYWLDKLWLLRLYRRPSAMSASTARRMTSLIPIAIALHLCIGAWMVSAPGLFEGTAASDDFEGSSWVGGWPKAIKDRLAGRGASAEALRYAIDRLTQRHAVPYAVSSALFLIWLVLSAVRSLLWNVANSVVTLLSCGLLSGVGTCFRGSASVQMLEVVAQLRAGKQGFAKGGPGAKGGSGGWKGEKGNDDDDDPFGLSVRIAPSFSELDGSGRIAGIPSYSILANPVVQRALAVSPQFARLHRGLSSLGKAGAKAVYGTPLRAASARALATAEEVNDGTPASAAGDWLPLPTSGLPKLGRGHSPALVSAGMEDGKERGSPDGVRRRLYGLEGPGGGSGPGVHLTDLDLARNQSANYGRYDGEDDVLSAVYDADGFAMRSDSEGGSGGDDDDYDSVSDYSYDSAFSSSSDDDDNSDGDSEGTDGAADSSTAPGAVPVAVGGSRRAKLRPSQRTDDWKPVTAPTAVVVATVKPASALLLRAVKSVRRLIDPAADDRGSSKAAASQAAPVKRVESSSVRASSKRIPSMRRLDSVRAGSKLGGGGLPDLNTKSTKLPPSISDDQGGAHHHHHHTRSRPHGAPTFVAFRTPDEAVLDPVFVAASGLGAVGGSEAELLATLGAGVSSRALQRANTVGRLARHRSKHALHLASVDDAATATSAGNRPGTLLRQTSTGTTGTGASERAGQAAPLRAAASFRHAPRPAPHLGATQRASTLRAGDDGEVGDPLKRALAPVAAAAAAETRVDATTAAALRELLHAWDSTDAHALKQEQRALDDTMSSPPGSLMRARSLRRMKSVAAISALRPSPSQRFPTSSGISDSASSAAGVRAASASTVSQRVLPLAGSSRQPAFSGSVRAISLARSSALGTMPTGVSARALPVGVSARAQPMGVSARALPMGASARALPLNAASGSSIAGGSHLQFTTQAQGQGRGASFFALSPSQAPSAPSRTALGFPHA